MLQVLSPTVFEKLPSDQLLIDAPNSEDDPGIGKQLKLIE